jgi:hypothetical protein
MKQALSNARNPAEASIEAVLPGVHDRLSALQNYVNSTTRTTIMDRLTNMCSDLMNHIQELNQHSRLELASKFAAAAASLVNERIQLLTGLHIKYKENF